MDASASILRADASWQLLIKSTHEVYFGYAWLPRDNLKAIDCCYYHDAGTHGRHNVTTGDRDRCGVRVKKCDAEACRAKSLPPFICNETGSTGGDNCIERMLGAAKKEYACPKYCSSENEVVLFREKMNAFSHIEDALSSLTAHNKPWPVALVLAYIQGELLNTTKAVRLQLLSSGALQKQRAVFANDTAVLVIKQVTRTKMRHAKTAPKLLQAIVRLDELEAFLLQSGHTDKLA